MPEDFSTAQQSYDNEGYRLAERGIMTDYEERQAAEEQQEKIEEEMLRLYEDAEDFPTEAEFAACGLSAKKMQQLAELVATRILHKRRFN